MSRIKLLFLPFALVLFVFYAHSSINTSVIKEVSEQDITFGDPNAENTIIEYASFDCGACMVHHQTTFQKLHKDYIKTGKVRYVYRPYPISRKAFHASVLVMCAIDKYGSQNSLDYVDVMYNTLREWTTRSFRLPMSILGLKENSCQSTYNSSFIQDMRYAAQDAGIQSTPTFIINDKVLIGMHDIEKFIALLD